METINANKIEVANPADELTTVGQVILDICNERGTDATIFGIKNLSSRERLSDRQFEKISECLALDSNFTMSMRRYQDDYIQKKAKCLATYKKNKEQYRKLKKILPLLGKDYNTGFDRLDDIVDFFGLDSEDAIFETVRRECVLYRQQTQSAIDDINLSGWLRRGTLDFMKIQDSIPAYNKDGLLAWIESREWEPKVKSVAYFMGIPKKLREFGVCVSLIPYLNNTVYGATKWEDGHPIVMVSDREQDLATCWVTLFHELGHVVLHQDRMEISIDGDLTSNKADREKEANQFAAKYLFNGDALRIHIFNIKKEYVYESQDEIGKKFGVNEMFVGYWMKKAQYYPAQHTHIPITFSIK